MHVSDDVVARLVAGELRGTEVDGVDEHLDACEACRELVAAAARSSVLAQRSERAEPASDPSASTWLASRGAGASAEIVRPELAEGTRVSRYVIVGTLGRGGMGVVYLAFDSMLHREVALKFVRSELAGSMGDDGRELLLAEGRAVARVSHPNVVAVHDVGIHRGGVFVAMEYVDAGTLGEHLAARPRDVKEILRLFADAADGLAAVHEAGLVHRDFKPANVLVGANGRVKVTDFGLAALRERALGEPSIDGDVEASQRAGRIVGTPAYMAPEQFDGGNVGPKADQFAFAVALHEALTRRRPYAGKSLTALAVACRHAKVDLGRDVPRLVHTTLRRALSADPADRLADMHAIADALRRATTPRWRRVVVPFATAAAAAGAAALLLPRSEPAPCEGVAAKVEQTWNAHARETVSAALTAAPRDAVERVTSGLDAYAEQLSAAQLRTCLAHRVEGTRSDTLFDLQMRCLDSRVVALATLADQLHADADMSRAIEAVVTLPPTHECEDTDRMMTRTALPTDPADRRIVDAASDALAEARVVSKLGETERALEIATRARDDLGEVHPPLRAELSCFVGDAQLVASRYDAAAEAFQRCADEAATAKDDALLAYAWIELSGIDGIFRGDYDAALARTPMLRTILQRAGEPPETMGHYSMTLGQLRERAGELEQAQTDLRAAIASFREANARAGVASGLETLAAMLYNQGEQAASVPLLREALEIHRELYGPTHARVLASELNGIIVEIEDSGKEADALGELTTRIDTHLGKTHRLAVHVRRNRADALRTAGRSAEAVPIFEETIELGVAVFGEHHAVVAEMHQLLAECLRVLQRYDEAIVPARRALAMQRELLPADHPDFAQSHETLGRLLLARGDAAHALPEYEEAMRISGLPPMNPVVHSRALTGRALALRELGRQAEACEAFGRALAVAEEAQLQRVRMAEAFIDHAACIAALGELERSQTEGSRGLEIYASIEGNDPSMLADYQFELVKAWWPHPALRARAAELDAAIERWLAANPTHAEHDRLRAAFEQWRRDR